MDRVKARKRELGLTNKDLAQILRIDETAVSKMLNGKRRVTAEEAAALSKALDIDYVGIPAIRQLPVIGRVPAGNWKEAIQDPIGMMPSPDDSISLDAFVVEVDGDSMDKVAPDGTRIVVDPTDRDLISKRFYVIRNGFGEVTFKQFLSDPARLEPCSTNDNHKTIYPGRDEFVVVGRVIWKSERM